MSPTETMDPINTRYTEAMNAFREGHFADAFATFEESLPSVRGGLSPMALTVAIHCMGECAAILGQAAVAVPLLEEASERYQRLGEEPGHARCLFLLGRCAFCLGHHETARQILEQAKASYSMGDDRCGLASIACMEGEIAHAEGRHQEAFAFFSEAGRCFAQAGDRVGEAEVLFARSEVEIALGRLRAAEGCLEDAWERAREIRDPSNQELLARIQIKRGEYHVLWGHPATAESALAEACQLFEHCGNRRRMVLAVASSPVAPEEPPLAGGNSIDDGAGIVSRR